MAAGDLISLADLKTWLNISGTGDDALLSRLITSASSRIASYLQRNIGTLSASITEVRNGSGTSAMMPKMWPVTAVTSLTVGGVVVPQAQNGGGGWFAQVWDGVSFPIPEPYISLTSGWSPIGGEYGYGRWNGIFPVGAGNVAAVYTAGFTAVPADLYQACIEMIDQTYKRRGTRLDTKSVNQAGQSTSYEMNMLPSVKEMLQPYRRVAPIIL